MKRRYSVLIFIVALVLIFFIGIMIGNLVQKQKFTTCKDLYDNLKSNPLCENKIEDAIGKSWINYTVEWFNLGAIPYSLILPDRECEKKFNEDYIKTGKHKSALDCFVNSIEIVNSTLQIQCGCFYE